MKVLDTYIDHEKVGGNDGDDHGIFPNLSFVAWPLPLYS